MTVGRNKIPDENKRKTVGLSLNADEEKMLDYICKYNGMTRACYIRHLIAKEHRIVMQHREDRLNETAQIHQKTSNQMHSAIGLDVS